MLKEKLKTALIALLTLTALLLCGFTFAENGDFIASKSNNNSLKTYKTSQSTNPGLPAYFVFVREGVSVAVKTDNSVKNLFESAGGILLESLGSSGVFGPASEREYIAALRGSGLLFAYAGSLPLSVVSSGKFSSDLCASSVFLSSSGETLSIYIEDAASSKFYVSPSALKSTALSPLSPSGYNCSFACALFADSGLPASTCFSGEPTYGTLTLTAAAENGVYSDELSLVLLSAFMGDTYTSRSFTDSDGCRNYLIDGGRIRLGDDGYVCFSAEEAGGIPLTALDISLSSDAMADACRAALSVMSSAVGNLAGDLRYSVRGASADQNGKISVTLGALCEGCPVVRNGGFASWAYFEFKDGYLIRAELSLYSGRLTQNVFDAPVITPEFLHTEFSGRVAGRWLTTCYVASPEGIYTKNWLALGFPE